MIFIGGVLLGLCLGMLLMLSLLIVTYREERIRTQWRVCRWCGEAFCAEMGQRFCGECAKLGVDRRVCSTEEE